MIDPNFVILYVDNPPASARFYRDLLDRQPVETSPNFVMFRLTTDVMLGLWSRADVEPGARAAAGSGELCFSVRDAAEVDATHAAWRTRGLNVVQSPVDMDFGRTFLALDPDGHRLRVFAPVAR